MTDTVNVPRGWLEKMLASNRLYSFEHNEIRALLAAAPKAEPVSDHQDIEELIADAIGDSIDMDWTSRDGAKAVVKALEKEGLTIRARPEAPKAEVLTCAGCPRELLEAAVNLRAAQRAYMADRGNEALGKAVGVAAERLDCATAQHKGPQS